MERHDALASSAEKIRFELAASMAKLWPTTSVEESQPEKGCSHDASRPTGAEQSPGKMIQ